MKERKKYPVRKLLKQIFTYAVLIATFFYFHTPLILDVAGRTGADRSIEHGSVRPACENHV